MVPRMDFSKNQWIPIVVALIVAVLLSAWWVMSGNGTQLPEFGAVRPSALTQGAPYVGAPLTADYTNETFRFSLDIPEGFTAGELPEDENGGTAIILQNAQGEGIQIYVVPAEESQKVLTAEDILTSIPDIQVASPEVVEIGNDYKGVAFLSDNAAFSGASREVWFYFRGNLYQISTYQRLDTLLKAIFATWKFY